MKSLFLLLLWMTISFIGSLTAQTATDSNEGLRITKDSSGDGLTLFWYGRTGRTYFVQQSPDLLQWKYLPIMDSGTGAPLSYGVSTTASRGFFRLSYTDDPLAGDPDGDFDGDGMSNMDELLNAQYGYDPFDFYNGQTPTLQLVSGGGQWGAPGEVLAQPIIVSVNSGASNAPVTFTVSSGGALLSQNGNLPWNSQLSVRTSAATGRGLVAAQAYGKLPATSSKVSTITITAGKATLQTTATTYDPTVPMPTALQAVPTSPTTVQLSWTAGDATRATSIEISRDDGANWQLYDVAEPGVSSFQITGLTPDVEVSFRVLTGDKRKAMMQGNASLGTWDWLKGYAGLWGAAWEWSKYSLLPHEVTAPTPEFLSDPTARVKTLPVSVPQLYVESVYRSDSRDGYQGFQDLNSVYLRWYQEETCSFGSGSLKNKEQSTTTFVWNPETYSQSSTSTGDPQVTTPDVEPTEEILSDTSRKETYKDNYWDYKFSVTLSNSYTLSTFITNVESWVPAFTGNRTLVQNNPLYPYYSQDNSAQASIFLMESPPWSDDTDSYAIKKLRYQWKVNSDENAVVVWDVRFTPADGSAVQHDFHSWATHGDTESPVFEIDPTALNSKKNGTYQVGLVPIDIKWVAKDDWDNVDDNPDPFSPDHKIVGKQIFPDALEPNGDWRKEVKLKISIPGLSNTKVYLKVFDVDDPSSIDDPNNTLDPTDTDTKKAGNDNRQAEGLSNLWMQQGWFLPSHSDQISVDLDSYGEAEARFEVTPQPGNNYRVALALASADLDSLQVDDSNAASYVTPDDAQVSGFKGQVSPLLTVWRKLNIEVDSMEKVPDNKLGPDHVTATGDHWVTEANGAKTLYLSTTLSEGAGFYDGGYIKAGNETRKIVSHTANTIDIGFKPTSGSFIGAIDVYDDDDAGITDSVLPKSNVISQGVKDIYKRGYIDIIELASNLNPTKTMPFELYSEHDSLGTTSLLSSKDTEGLDAAAFWCHYLIMAYQPRKSLAHDPNDTGLIEGVTSVGPSMLHPFSQKKFSAVFVETIRETQAIKFDVNSAYNIRQDEIVSHEIGHAPGCKSGHPESSGLMEPDPKHHDFSAESLLRFRKTQSWEASW